jgi:hypothetical protein
LTVREALSAVPATVREQPFGALAVAVAVALCLVVAGVGAVAIWAELEHTWRSFFLMEQVMEMAAPATKLLLVAVVVTGLGTVAMAR